MLALVDCMDQCCKYPTGMATITLYQQIYDITYGDRHDTKTDELYDDH